MAITRDMNEHDSPAFRLPREGAGKIGDAESIEAISNRRKSKGAAFRKLGSYAFQINHYNRSKFGFRAAPGLVPDREHGMI
jgi:hypothetical protein